MHSGTFGGAVNNPAQVLCKIIACLHDKDGRVNIPGFYGGVSERSAFARAYMKYNNRSDEEILKDAGAICGSGEKGYSLYESIVTRPSLSINGITAGYQGEGSKAIIPARASAKISIRLFPKQDPGYVENLLRNYLQTLIPPCSHFSLKRNASSKPVFLDASNIYMKAATTAYEQVFKKRVIMQGSGGTIPVVKLLYENLSMPVILMGFASPDDHPHGLNEKFALSNFRKGIATSIYFPHELGKLSFPAKI